MQNLRRTAAVSNILGPLVSLLVCLCWEWECGEHRVSCPDLIPHSVLIVRRQSSRVCA